MAARSSAAAQACALAVPGIANHLERTSEPYMAKVKIYTTSYCGFCRMAQRLLEQKGVDYEQVDVTSDPDARTWLREASGQRTVPQIFINDEPIGGYMELSALDRTGELDRKLSA